MLRKKVSSLRSSARFCQKRRPGSLGRPRHCRRDLPTREEQSGQVPYFHDVPYAWGLHQRVLCVACSRALAEKAARCPTGGYCVEAIHCRSRNTYGRPRIKAELKDDGISISNDRLARLMSERRLQGASRRKGIRTTVRDRDARPAPDLVDRKFVAEAPNKLWVADITYVPTYAGFLFLAIVLDAFSRRVVGWATSSNMKTQLVLDALNMAIYRRRPIDVVHHSDQGTQYTSIAFG